VELEACEWIPYRQLLPHLDTIMVGHLRNGHLAPDGKPTSLSPHVVTGLLREQFQYQGLIMTDDIDMGAVLNQYGTAEAAQLAMTAGNDLILLCHQVEKADEAVAAIEALPEEVLAGAQQRVTDFRQWLMPPEPFSMERFHALDAEIYQLRVDTLGEERAAERSPNEGKRSPVETY
jgi:beta-N-acetylhexosaminidase